MSFLERAKSGLDSLSTRADDALNSRVSSGSTSEIELLLRDLGVITFLEQTGQPVDEAHKQRIIAALGGYHSRGALRGLAPRGGSPSAPGAPPPPAPSGVPPERAGRHGDFLSQPRQTPLPALPSDSPNPVGQPPPAPGPEICPDADTGPRPRATGSRPPQPPPPPGVG